MAPLLQHVANRGAYLALHCTLSSIQWSASQNLHGTSQGPSWWRSEGAPIDWGVKGWRGIGNCCWDWRSWVRWACCTNCNLFIDTGFVAIIWACGDSAAGFVGNCWCNKRRRRSWCAACPTNCLTVKVVASIIGSWDDEASIAGTKSVGMDDPCCCSTEFRSQFRRACYTSCLLVGIIDRSERSDWAQIIE